MAISLRAPLVQCGIDGVTEYSGSAARNEASPRPWPVPGPDPTWWRDEPTESGAAQRNAQVTTQMPVSAPLPATTLAPAGGPRKHRRDRWSRTPELTVPEPEPDAGGEPAAELPPAAAEAENDGFPLWPSAQPADTAAGPAQPSGGAGGDSPRLPDDGQPPPGDSAAQQWPAPSMRAGRRFTEPAPPVKTKRRRVRRLRQPAVGLVALLLLTLLAGFIAWVNADAFWLAVGHRSSGTATVSGCTGTGLGVRCTGSFAADDHGFAAPSVVLSAVPLQARHAGAAVPATMVSARGRIAYAGAPQRLLLRWLLGLALVLLCGLGIAWATGAWRLTGRAARTGAFLTSLGAPLVLFVGIVAAAW